MLDDKNREDSREMSRERGKGGLQAWLELSGLHGKLLAGGALLGLICVFLPLATITIGSVSGSLMIIEDWRGVISLIGYIACGVFAFILYLPEKLGAHKNLMIGLLVAAGLVALMALLMLIAARNYMGFGTIFNLFAAGAVGAGAFLKAREEKVF